AAAADEHRRAAQADLDEDVYFRFIVTTADKALERSVERGRFEIDGRGTEAGAVPFFAESIGVGAAGTDGDYFVFGFAALADFARRDDLDARVLLGHAEHRHRFELCSLDEIVNWHGRQTEILHRRLLTRQRNHNLAAAEIGLAHH